MGRTIVDIDELLAEDQLILSIDKTKYVVNDVPLVSFMKAMKEVEDDPENKMKETHDLLHRQLAIFLDVDVESIKHLGIKSVGIALNEVRKWMLGEVMQITNQAEAPASKNA